MVFNPLRFESNTNKGYSDITSNTDGTHKCSYLIPEQFCSVKNESCGKINLLNVNKGTKKSIVPPVTTCSNSKVVNVNVLSYS